MSVLQEFRGFRVGASAPLALHFGETSTGITSCFSGVRIVNHDSEFDSVTCELSSSVRQRQNRGKDQDLCCPLLPTNFMWIRSKLFWKICSFYLLPTVLVLGLLLTALAYQLENTGRNTVIENLRSRLISFRSDLVDDATSDQVVEKWNAVRRSIDKTCYVLTRTSTEGVPTFEVTRSRPPQNSDSDSRYQIQLPESVQRKLWRQSENGKTAISWDPQLPDVAYAATRLEPEEGRRCLILRHDARARLYDIGTVNQTASFAILLAWLAGAACLIIVAALVASPLQSLVSSLASPSDSLARRDAMFRLRDRNDELGDLAREINDLENAHQKETLRQESEVTTMRESKNQLSAILQAMVEGVIAIDAEQSILFANDVACRLMDLDSHQAIGRPLFECVRSSVVLDTVGEALNSNELESIEFKLPRSDAFLNLVVSPLAKGGVVLVLNDVTEIRRLEVLRKDFMNGVSHELKTPLTVIQACTDTLINGAIQDPETARRFLRKISAQSERLHHLIVGMLQLSRVESGQQIFNEEAVDVASLARELTMQMQPIADGSSIALNYDGPEETFVLGDHQAIRTIINNLIDNALKYTNERGRVDVLVREEQDANVVSVKDNGVGISREDQARIFERFYRVEKDRNRERGGTGLGLAIVKHLCNALQAEVSVRSEQGAGCEFLIRFPFREDGLADEDLDIPSPE